MRRIVFAGVAGVLLALAAQAADIYRWTDENGRVHLSDTVPPRYQATAKRIDSRQFDLSPAQRGEAEARLARDRKALAASAPPPSEGQGAAPLPASTIRPAPPIRPVPPASASGNAECEALQREYRESLECFAPYVNGNGTLKPNAFAVCKSVVDPTLKCGPPKSY